MLIKNCYVAYLIHILRHIYRIFKLGREMDIPLWNLLIHDIGRFLPSEFFAYARTFYNSTGELGFYPSTSFQRAQHRHLKHNKHHWQYWVLFDENNEPYALDMPICYIKEYVADLMTDGIHIPYSKTTYNFFITNEERIIMSRFTKHNVRAVFKEYDPSYYERYKHHYEDVVQ